jgi:hypothetical protein
LRAGSSADKRGNRWTASDKKNAISIYLKSPAAYRVLAKKWCMPAKSTLLRPLRSLFRKVKTICLCYCLVICYTMPLSLFLKLAWSMPLPTKCTQFKMCSYDRIGKVAL